MKARPGPKPDREEYFLNIAKAVAGRADCLRRKVGAVLVQEERIVSTGYNGTPKGLLNCTDGGCHRCKHDEYEPGKHYDICVCVHAEANALAAAARFGIAIEGATLYATHQPCFGCAKELLQAGVHRIHYAEAWDPPDELKEQYKTLLAAFQGGCHARSSTNGVRDPLPMSYPAETATSDLS
jgi:dCMP deaminase